MATHYKILGQVNPAATTDTNLYTVPSSTEAVISTVSICNAGSAQVTYRIAARKDGESLAQKHYITYDAIIPANDMIALTLGMTADSGDIFSVYASSASVSFNMFGSEIS